ncbi:MAG: DUF615 domain-containing protein [Myxococcales bacterium]
MVRKLEQYIADQAKAAADDRNLLSRSEERREEQQLERQRLALATRLTGLKPNRLETLGLPEDMLEILDELRVIQSAPARTRALKHLRAELRRVDLEQLNRQIDMLSEPAPARPQSPAAEWCDRLMRGDDEVLREFVLEHASADRSQLRALLRKIARSNGADRERARGKLLAVVQSALRQPRPDTDVASHLE